MLTAEKKNEMFRRLMIHLDASIEKDKRISFNLYLLRIAGQDFYEYHDYLGLKKPLLKNNGMIFLPYSIDEIMKQYSSFSKIKPGVDDTKLLCCPDDEHIYISNRIQARPDWSVHAFEVFMGIPIGTFKSKITNPADHIPIHKESKYGQIITDVMEQGMPLLSDNSCGSQEYMLISGYDTGEIVLEDCINNSIIKF